MLRIELERVMAWWISIDTLPGYAKTSFTPWRSRASTRTLAPLRGSLEANLEMKGCFFACCCLDDSLGIWGVMGAAEFVVVAVDFGRGRELEMWRVQMGLWEMWEKGRVYLEMRDLDDKEEE